MSKLSLIVFAVCAMTSFALQAVDDGAASSSDLKSENTFGLLRVDSTAKETIVAVPWVQPGSNDQPINVKNLISSKNISNGDELFVYLGSYGQYAGYVFDNGEWKSANNVIIMGKITQSGDLAATHPRGNALVLRRKNASKPFYLFGQVGKTVPQSVDLVAGAYNLIAPPSDCETDMCDKSNYQLTGGDFTNKDAIQMAGLVYSYSASIGWSYKTRKGTTYLKIPAGQGAWLNLSATSPITKITWTKCPTAK